MSHYIKTIMILMILCLVQGCASGGGLNSKVSESKFKWNTKHSTALNVLRAIDVDYVEEDKELPPNLREQAASSGASEVFFAAADGLSFSRSAHSLGHLSDAGSMGLGVMSFLTSTNKEFYYNPHIVFWLPYKDGETLQSHIGFVTSEIKKAYNNLIPLHPTNTIDPWEINGSQMKSKAHIWLDHMDKNLSMKVLIKIREHGVVGQDGSPPSLKNHSKRWLIVSGELDRGGLYFNEQAVGLSENTFFFIYNDKPKKKYQASYDPRVIHENRVFRFIKPLN